MSVSGGVSIARIRGENRFYHPPAMRRRLQQQQQELQRQSALDSKEVVVAAATNARIDELEKSEVDECRSWSTRFDCSVSDRRGSDSTNLDRFLEHTTPFVQARCVVSKSGLRGWSNREVLEAPPYFVLGDLWESFREWSAYGAGIPLLLNGSDSVKQYYAPYLSGIQLYLEPSKSSDLRRGADSDAESSKETSNDGSSTCGAEKKNKTTRTLQDEWIQNSGVMGSQRALQMNVPSAESSSDESDSCYRQGQLVFEYFECDPPFCREPLTDKITILASRFPELKTYRSCDLSPSSWISVAWYPIYRIPTGQTLQSLDACFLTFHSLSTTFQGGIGPDGLQFHRQRVREVYSADFPLKLQLPTFGLASYKFKTSFWNSSGAEECPKANTLWQEADNWLRENDVDSNIMDENGDWPFRNSDYSGSVIPHMVFSPFFHGLRSE